MLLGVFHLVFFLSVEKGDKSVKSKRCKKMVDRIELKYSGLPFKPVFNGKVIGWKKLYTLLRHKKGNDVWIDGWVFNVDYGMLYFQEVKKWGYYLPPSGVKDKKILSVGGGCGEDAKFFIEQGADSVSIIEANPICE